MSKLLSLATMLLVGCQAAAGVEEDEFPIDDLHDAATPDTSSLPRDARASTDSADTKRADATRKDGPPLAVVTRAAIPCPTALLCEDFETYNGIPSGPWRYGERILSTYPGKGSLLLADRTKPFSGTRSLHIRALGGDLHGGEATVIRTSKGLPAPGNHVFGRMMMFLKAPWPTTHIRLMGMQNNDPEAGYMLNAHENVVLEALVDKVNGGGTAPLILNSWQCLEWEFNAPTGGFGQTAFWINSKKINPQPAGFPRVDMLNIWIGYTTTGGGGPAEMWFDDLALGTARIGCPEAT